MKKNNSGLVFLIFTVFFLFSVSSCSDDLHLAKSLYGSVNVRLQSESSSEAYAIPQPTDTDVSSYRFTLSQLEGTSLVKTSGLGSTVLKYNKLLPGFYLLTVEELHSGGNAISVIESDAIQVYAGKKAEIAITYGSSSGNATPSGNTTPSGNISPAIVLQNNGSTLSFNVSAESPFCFTDSHGVSHTVTSLAPVDISDYTNGTYTVFVTADNQTVLIKDYAEGTDYPPAYQQAGSPTISANGDASNFSTSRYLQLTEPFDPGDKPWESVTTITTGTDISNHQTIKGSSVDCQGFYVCLENRKFSLCAGNLGRQGSALTEWSFTGDWWYGTQVISTNTKYYLRARYTGTAYTLEYSTDGVNYSSYLSVTQATQSTAITSGITTNWGTISADIPVYGCTADAWDTGMQLVSNMTIHMNETYLKIDGEYYWTGAYGYTNAARLDTSGATPVLTRMTENGPVVWDAASFNDATVTISNGSITAITQP